MTDERRHDPAHDPLDLERFLVTRQRDGDLDGMLALYEPDAVLDVGEGHVVAGLDAIRAYFADAIESGQRYAIGEQRPALVSGDLALTSTRLPDGTVTAEVARRQSDGTWRWVIDRFTVG